MSNKKKMRLIASLMLVFIFGSIVISLFPIVATAVQYNTASQIEPVIKEVIKEVVVEKEVIVEKEVPVEKEIVVEKDVLSGYEELDVPEVNSSFKAYMDYRTITNVDSIQYKIQQEAYTDELGFRKYDNYYMVALGTFYSTQCGERFIIEFESGVMIRAITGDIKDNSHTNSTHQYTVNKSNIVEFIVDTNKLNKDTKLRGDVSYSGLLGKVIKIYKEK